MAVQFEFYKNPGTGEEGEEEQYHPRVVNFNSVSTEYLAAEIHRATTFGEAEVEGVLMSLSHFMSSHLKNGERVHLKGIGYFQVTLQTTEPVYDVKTRSDKVSFKAIRFQADKELKGELYDMHIQRSKWKCHSAVLSEEEIDRRLTEFFTIHQVLIRRNLQSICQFTQIMASRHIQRLKEQGKIENIGTRFQPIYVHRSGYYGK